MSKQGILQDGQFKYKCDVKTAQLIQGNARFLNDLRSVVGPHAICEHVHCTRNGGSVMLRLKQHGIKVQLIRLLDEFFQKFTFASKPVDLKRQKNAMNLEGSFPNLLIKWNFSNNSVSAVGLKCDVDEFMQKIKPMNPEKFTDDSRPLSAKAHSSKSRSMGDLRGCGLSISPSKPKHSASVQPCIECRAPDREVLKFLSSFPVYHKRLNSLCSPFGRMEFAIEEGKIKLFRNKKFDQALQDRCSETVSNFLRQFDSYKCNRNVNQLKALYASNPGLFRKHDENNNLKMLARFDPNGCLTICGYRDLVNEAASVFNHLLHSGLKEKRVFVFHKDTEEFIQIIRFVSQNQKAKLALKDLCSDLGCQYQFDPNVKSPNQLILKNIPDHVTNNALLKELISHFGEYTCRRHDYDKNLLLKMRMCYSQELENLEKRDVYIRWENLPEIMFVGQKNDVDVAFSTIGSLINRTHQNISIGMPLKTQLYQSSDSGFSEILKFIAHSKIQSETLRIHISEFAQFDLVPNKKSPTAVLLNVFSTRISKKEVENTMAEYFKQFVVRQQTFDKKLLQKAKQTCPNVFASLHLNDVSINWSNQPELLFVGKKGNVNSCISLINEAVKHVTANRRGSKEDKPNITPFKYQKATETFRNILAFVSANNVQKKRLGKVIKGVAKYEFIFEDQSPIAVNFLPVKSAVPAEFNKTSQIAKKFFDEFDSVAKSVKPDLAQCLKENFQNLFPDLSDEIMEVSWSQNSVTVTGLKEKVSWLMEQIETLSSSYSSDDQPLKTEESDFHEEIALKTQKRKPCSKDVCRILINCGVVDKVNDIFEGKLIVNCNLEEEYVEFSGQQSLIQEAEAIISSMELEEKEPCLTGMNAEYLVEVLQSDVKEKESLLIYKQFSDNGVQGALVLKDGNLLLVATDSGHFKQACILLDQIICNRIVSVPVSNQNKAHSRSLKKLMESLSKSKSVMVKEKDNIVWVLGLVESNVDDTTSVLKNFLRVPENVLLTHKCADHVTSFLTRHCAADRDFPDDITVCASESEVLLMGLPTDAVQALQYVEDMKLNSSVAFFNAQSLTTHVSTFAWKDFVRSLEGEVKCVVSYEDETEEDVDGEDSPRDEKRRISVSEDQPISERKVADIAVQVAHGDITKESCDAIVNGCTGDFHLNRGVLSKLVWQRAGPKIQAQIHKNPVRQTPVLRVTEGFKLKCKYVIHLVTPRSGPKYVARVRSALDYAAKLGCSSVALPTLGAGRIGLTEGQIASYLSEAIKRFAENGESSIKTIKVVVFDQSCLPTMISTILQRANGKSGLTAKVDSPALIARLVSKCQPQSFHEAIRLRVTYGEPAAFEKVKRKIAGHLQRAISTSTVENGKQAVAMHDSDIIEMLQLAIENEVFLKLNSQKDQVLGFTGLADNVKTVELHYQRLVAEAFVASKNLDEAKWSTPKNHLDLPPRVSLAIETAYKKNPKGSGTVPCFGDPLTFNFSTMSYTFQTNAGKLSRHFRESKTENGRPPNWVDMGVKDFLKASVSPGTAEYVEVAELFKSTRPTGSVILLVERIQNLAAFKKLAVEQKKSKGFVRLFYAADEKSANLICAHGFKVIQQGAYLNFCKSASLACKLNPVETNNGLRYVFLATVPTDQFEGSTEVFTVLDGAMAYPAYLITFG